MAKKKKKSRLKKILGAVGKAAMLGGAAYGASKLLRGNKGNVLKTAAMEDANIPNRRLNALKAMTTDDAYTDQYMYDPIRTGGKGVKYSPRKKVWTGNQTMGGGDMFYTPTFKKGGRVTGIAKRGFGRALMKGKK